MPHAVELKVAVLIVGSLFWDSDSGRVAWRKEWLNLSSQLNVRVPIRYGRLSRSRDCTYTMVIDPACPFGVGKLVSCRKTFADFKDLEEEAKALWKAEKPTARDDELDSDWGQVAILVNPTAVDAQPLCAEWTETRKGIRRHASQDGIMSIGWPVTVDGEPASADLILGITTEPTPHAKTGELPDAHEVTRAWRRSGEKSTAYFWNNRENGIETFMDEEIKRLLRA